MRNFLIGAALLVSLASAATAEPIKKHRLRYGDPRTFEAGASAGLTIATDSRDFNVTPSIGYFFQQYFQLSGIVSVSRVDTEMDTSFVVTALVEPSYHVPIAPRAFGFFGLGAGSSWVQDVGTGLALAPRLGANFTVGGSGVITPSLSWQYSTVGAATALRVNLGYTVLW
jgi:hypothetical protein